MEKTTREYVYTGEMIKVYKLGGLWFETPGRFGPLVHITLWLRILVLVSMQLAMGGAVVYAGSAYFTTPSSPYLTLGMAQLVMGVPFWTRFHFLKSFLLALEAGLGELREDWQQRIIWEEYSRSRKLAFFYLGYTIGFATVFPIVGVFTDTIHMFLGREIYRFPQCLEVFDTDTTRTPRHYLILLAYFIWMNVVCAQNVAVINSMFVFTGFVKAELRILIGMIEKLPPSTPSRPTVWCLREIIAFHQEIKKIHKMYTELLGFTFATHNILGGINTCLIGICLLYQFQYGGVLLFIMVLTFALNFLALLLLCCLEGETLQDKNDELGSAIYNVPWYDQPTYVKKTILMMIREIQIPLTLDYKGNVPLNLNTYAQTMSNAYSFFNLYLKSLK